jgi:2-polyprenyl-6-methoxyphenol hydroxylase-like FAD-dependent oxidoreductase
MSKTHAIIIGGSIAGLLTARVLSDHFDSVTILERDTLPDSLDVRNGVPQGHHLHALLARGQEVMEELLPGITADLIATGAPSLDWGKDTLFVGVSGEMPRKSVGLVSNLTSRPSLEYIIRKRVRQIPNIEWHTQTQVDCLLHEDGKIVGVQTYNRETHESMTLMGNLIVDVSGRASKTPEWLVEMGYEAPQETEVNAFIGYATRWYEVPQGYEPDWKTLSLQGNVETGNLRQGAIFRTEGNRYVLTLQGSNKDYPPTDEAEFMAFAKTLEAPHLYEFMQIATPISPIYGYRRTQNRIRHYEKLTRRPENLIVLGDAYCGFNPVYGQGMTVAAMQVVELRKLLQGYNVQQLEGFAAKFQKRISKVIQTSWLMATAEDLRYPLTEGTKADGMIRFMQHYSGWVFETMVHDHTIATAFFMMMNLKSEGTALMHPNILFRVMWHKFIHPKAKRAFATQTIDTMRRFNPVFAR